MKKIVFCLMSMVLLSGAVVAQETVKLSVKEEQKNEYQQQVERYQKKAHEIVAAAEAEIMAAQQRFDDTKRSSEKIITDAQAQVEKAKIDAQKAQETFEKVKTETNAKIEAANARIKKATDELKQNIEALQKKAATSSAK